VHKLIRLVSLLAISLLPLAAQAQQQPIRVISGGPRYTDSKGQLWQADYAYKYGIAATIPAVITGTPDQGLYQHLRTNASSTDPFEYNFSVPNGLYHVNLYFAETSAPSQVVGARVFDIKIQGTTVFWHVDVFAEAGANAPLIKGTDVTVTNGRVSLEFDNLAGNATVDAIEILPGTSGPQLSLNFKYPDGTAVTGTLTYTVSSSLLTFEGSEPLVNGQVSCELLANPSTLGISAQFTIFATLTDTAGHQLWQLNLGMNPALVNLATVQSSALTVVVQKRASSAGA
jgi:hypothetical protein